MSVCASNAAVLLTRIGNLSVLLAPAATFAVYAIQATILGSESLDTKKAFTSLGLITLVSYPASRILSAVPNTAASLGGFGRIQTFLLATSRSDERLSEPSTDFHSRRNSGFVLGQSTVPEVQLTARVLESGNEAIHIKNATMRPARDANIVLHEVNLIIEKGSTIMITGAVGTGKSTLLKAILGEITCDCGTVSVSTKHMAYCSQTAWLPNGTIRSAICGFADDCDSSIDESWYNMVIEACALDYDISNLPNGEKTPIGSRGIMLSGGQKQRIALARALYCRPEIFILDDVLSALDKKTEKKILESLFGSAGLFQKLNSTVVLVTHASESLFSKLLVMYAACIVPIYLMQFTGQYFSLADQIAVVATDGTIVTGTYKELKRTELTDIADGEFKSVEIYQDTFKEPLNEILTDVTDATTEAQDLARRSGDLAVYRYYFKSIGATKMLMFVIFVFLNVFCASFSGKL